MRFQSNQQQKSASTDRMGNKEYTNSYAKNISLQLDMNTHIGS